MRLGRAFSYVLATLLASTALWVAWPSRNIHGNPHLETLTTSCMTSSGVVARLYEGNGGATTAYWYTVTSESKLLGREKQVWFSYRGPAIDGLSCADRDLVLWANGSLFERLPLADLVAARANPIQYWSGQRTQLAEQPLSNFKWFIVAVLLCGAAGILAFTRPPRRTEPPHADSQETPTKQ
jgi:hypothetical protein